MYYDDKPIQIKMADKPNLMALRFNNPDAFKEILSACIALAERAAYSGDDRKISWYDIPGRFSDRLTFANTLKAVTDAVFDVEQLNPESYTILEDDVHALAVFKSSRDKSGLYPDWRAHFDFPEGEGKPGPDEVRKVLRKLLYYARFVDIEKFSKAVLSNHLSVHQALPDLNAEKLPFIPALRYQQQKFGDLKVGKFWDEIGAFYGGEMSSKPQKCPACGHSDLEGTSNFVVCPSCNIGVKIN